MDNMERRLEMQRQMAIRIGTALANYISYVRYMELEGEIDKLPLDKGPMLGEEYLKDLCGYYDVNTEDESEILTTFSAMANDGLLGYSKEERNEIISSLLDYTEDMMSSGGLDYEYRINQSISATKSITSIWDIDLHQVNKVSNRMKTELRELKGNYLDKIITIDVHNIKNDMSTQIALPVNEVEFYEDLEVIGITGKADDEITANLAECHNELVAKLNLEELELDIYEVSHLMNRLGSLQSEYELNNFCNIAEYLNTKYGQNSVKDYINAHHNIDRYNIIVAVNANAKM